MDLAFVALRLRVWNLLFNLFILRHADYRYMDISLPIVLFCFFLFKFTQSQNPMEYYSIGFVLRHRNTLHIDFL